MGKNLHFDKNFVSLHVNMKEHENIQKIINKRLVTGEAVTAVFLNFTRTARTYFSCARIRGTRRLLDFMCHRVTCHHYRIEMTSLKLGGVVERVEIKSQTPCVPRAYTRSTRRFYKLYYTTPPSPPKDKSIMGTGF